MINDFVIRAMTFRLTLMRLCVPSFSLTPQLVHPDSPTSLTVSLRLVGKVPFQLMCNTE